MKGFRLGRVLLIVVVLALSGCAAFGAKVKQGTPQEEVEKLLGKPREAHRRWMPGKETREVWIYQNRGLSIKNHLYPDTTVIVFSNGKVLAKNPQDPYAPLYSLGR